MKWTKEKCKEAALKCKTRSEFWEKYSGASSLSSKNGWMDEICSHMKLKIKPDGYWTKDKCQIEALKYKSRKEFKKNCSGAYNISYKNNWMKDICSNMIKIRKENGYWTKDKCQIEALKYKTRSDFKKKCWKRSFFVVQK